MPVTFSCQVPIPTREELEEKARDVRDEMGNLISETKDKIELKFGDAVVHSKLVKEELEDKVIDLKDKIEDVKTDVAQDLQNAFLESQDDKVDIDDIEKEKVVIKTFRKK